MTSSRVSVCRSHASKLLTLTTYVLHARDHTAPPCTVRTYAACRSDCRVALPAMCIAPPYPVCPEPAGILSLCQMATDVMKDDGGISKCLGAVMVLNPDE